MIGKTALFVPSIAKKKLEKALSVEADTIYFDLEDSIGEMQKEEARHQLYEFLKSAPFTGHFIAVRINGSITPYWEEDLLCFAELEMVDAFLLPNGTIEAVKETTARLDQIGARQKLIVLIETAEGLNSCEEIGKCSQRLIGFQFGAEDYTADIHAERTMSGEEIYYARAKIVNAAHACRLEVLDTPFPWISETAALQKDAANARRFGFTGKAAIHPSHISIINTEFMPKKQEIEYAENLINALREQEKETAGAFRFRGAMIDPPIIQRAYDVLKRAGKTTL